MTLEECEKALNRLGFGLSAVIMEEREGAQRIRLRAVSADGDRVFENYWWKGNEYGDQYFLELVAKVQDYCLETTHPGPTARMITNLQAELARVTADRDLWKREVTSTNTALELCSEEVERHKTHTAALERKIKALECVVKEQARVGDIMENGLKEHGEREKDLRTEVERLRLLVQDREDTITRIQDEAETRLSEERTQVRTLEKENGKLKADNEEFGKILRNEPSTDAKVDALKGRVW